MRFQRNYDIEQQVLGAIRAALQFLRAKGKENYEVKIVLQKKIEISRSLLFSRKLDLFSLELGNLFIEFFLLKI